MASEIPDGRHPTDLGQRIAGALALIAFAKGLIEEGRPVELSILREAIGELVRAVNEGDAVDEESYRDRLSALERGLTGLADLQTARCQAFSRYRQEVLARSPFRKPPRRRPTARRASRTGPESGSR
jgi:hypothetical protein